MNVTIDPASFKFVMDGLKGLPKEANAELRTASMEIAERILKPIIQRTIRQQAGPYGEKLAESVRVRKDRIPKVAIGNRRKVFSGGASTNIIRFGTIKGPYFARDNRENKQMWAQSVTPGWTKEASDNYLKPVFHEWEKTVVHIVDKWNGSF